VQQFQSSAGQFVLAYICSRWVVVLTVHLIAPQTNQTE
jgi:hypothetical protein